VSWIAPNLAHRPFENLRPMRRISLLLTLLAILLTAWNVATWLRTGAGAAEKAAELERLTAETAKARAEIETLESDLRSANLEEANQQIEFLNEQIAARTFSWNHLFEDLVEVLPSGVRLRRVTPSVERSRRSGRSERTRRPASPGEELVSLELSGEAESQEMYREFIDRLFASDRFQSTNPSGDTEGDDRLVQFNLSTLYRPGGSAGATP